MILGTGSAGLSAEVVCDAICAGKIHDDVTRNGVAHALSAHTSSAQASSAGIGHRAVRSVSEGVLYTRL